MEVGTFATKGFSNPRLKEIVEDKKKLVENRPSNLVLNKYEGHDVSNKDYRYSRQEKEFTGN